MHVTMNNPIAVLDNYFAQQFHQEVNNKKFCKIRCSKELNCKKAKPILKNANKSVFVTFSGLFVAKFLYKEFFLWTKRFVISGFTSMTIPIT